MIWGGGRLGERTYVLGDAAALPPVAVHHGAEAVPVVQPALGALELGAEHGDALAAPDRAQDVPLQRPRQVSKRTARPRQGNYMVDMERVRGVEQDLQPP